MGVKNRAADQGRCKLSFFSKLVLLLSRTKTASLTSSICWGILILPRAQRHCYVYSLRRNQDLPPGCTIVSPWSPHPLPSLISNCLNALFGARGRSWRLKPIPQQEMGDAENLGCPGAPLGPAGFPKQPEQERKKQSESPNIINKP